MSTDDSPDGTSTWIQPRFVIAAVVVALIAVFGVVLAVTGPTDGDEEPAPRADPTSAPPTAQPDDDDSVCGLEPGDQTIPVVAPPNTDWELVGTVAVPTDPTGAGPGEVDDSALRTCFARSPLGVLYAAVNFFAAASEPELQKPAAETLVARGPGRDRAVREASTQATSSAASGAGTQVVGFTFLNYSNTASTVDLAFRTSGTTGLVHLPLSLRWEAGDWKVVLPAEGPVFPGLGPIPDLTGYAPWSGA